MMSTPYGYGYGFGATAALVQGTDFKCVDKAGKPLPICFGIGTANHALLQQLQQTLNRARSASGAAQLTVDGFIGPATVTAFLTFKNKIGFAPDPSIQTKEQIAAAAPTIIPFLNDFINHVGSQLPPASPGVPVQPTAAAATAIATGAPPPIIPVAALTPGAPAAALPTKKSNTAYIILGGIAAVLLVGGVGFVVYRRKARQA